MRKFTKYPSNITASIQLPIDPKDKIYDLYQIATTWCDDSKVDQILINNGTSPDSRFIVDENTDVMQAYIDLIDYIKNNVNPDILNEREYALVYGDEVEARGNIKASSIMASGNNNYTVGHCFFAEFSPMGFSNPEAAIKAWYRKQDDYIGAVYIDCKNSTYQDKLLNWVLDNEAKVRQLDAKYSCMLKADYLIDCCRKALEGNSKCYPFTDYKSVEACDKVMAAIHVGEFDLERSESNVENDLGVTARDDGDWIYFLSDDDATHMPSSCYDMNSYCTKLIKNRNYNGFKPKKLSYKSFENSVNKLVDSSSSLDEFETKYHSFLCSLIGLDVDACDKVIASSYPDGPEFNRICDQYASLDPWIPLDEIWDMVNEAYGNEDGLADDVVSYVEHCRDCEAKGIDPDDEDVDACDNVMASTTGQTSDFTVIQEIYDDGYVYMTEENVEPVYTQEYDVNLDEVLTKYPEAEKYGLKGWTDESFKPGDIITKTHFAKYVEFIVGDEQMYSDFKDYVAQHPEFDRPARNIEVRINNPSCLPSAEDERRKQSEELGKRLGKMLGLGRY